MARLSTNAARRTPARWERRPIKLRAVSDIHPVRPSALAEGIFRREIVPWGLLGLALGLVEGATAAVLVKQHFRDVAPAFAVNLAVALVSGAPAFSNVLSFVWANVAHGRARVQLIVALQAGFALLVGCVSFATRAAGGLLVTVLSVIAARVLWAGILTVRAAVWSANYPRNVLARITGRLVIVNSIAVACSAGLVGWALEAHAVDARWLYGGGAFAGLLGAWLYRAMRVRREFRLLAAEAASGPRSEPFSLRMLTQILKEDPAYREYMLWMGIFGGGTLMLTAQLVLLFSDRLHLSSGTQIGMLAVVPLITQPIFLPWWRASSMARTSYAIAPDRDGRSCSRARRCVSECGAHGSRCCGWARCCSAPPRPVLILAGIWVTTTSPRWGARSTTWECTSRSRACGAEWRRRSGYSLTWASKRAIREQGSLRCCCLLP